MSGSVIRFARSGLKGVREDGAELPMAPPGTDPVVRANFRAATKVDLNSLIEAAESFIQKP